MSELIVKALVAMVCDLICAHYNKRIDFQLPDDVTDILNKMFHVLEDGEFDGPVLGFELTSDSPSGEGAAAGNTVDSMVN